MQNKLKIYKTDFELCLKYVCEKSLLLLSASATALVWLFTGNEVRYTFLFLLYYPICFQFGKLQVLMTGKKALVF